MPVVSITADTTQPTDLSAIVPSGKIPHFTKEKLQLKKQRVVARTKQIRKTKQIQKPEKPFEDLNQRIKRVKNAKDSVAKAKREVI